MHVLGKIIISICAFCSIFGLVSSRRIQVQRSGKSCAGSNYCENPPNYPETKIRALVKNQTFIKGTFDHMGKRSINVLQLEIPSPSKNSHDGTSLDKSIDYKLKDSNGK
eukprot:TRINITY_DN2771_c0_g1_i3.p1 TRINITY_DN2771_c0_g1~~TRINITY_DN2771_c0_g1_i3.p1  ORF type:complete len:109 (+),score=13.04 TRINITY_DN2771_c0_g1_i3:114-440(+)